MGKAIDLTGTKIGMLSIIERKIENNRTYYLCKCDCGNEKWLRSDCIIKKNKISNCGCVKNYKSTDITGKRFGRLVAIKRVGVYYRSPLWECKCDCGNVVNIPILNLNNGGSRSCGCLKNDNITLNFSKADKDLQLLFLKELLSSKLKNKQVSRSKVLAIRNFLEMNLKTEEEKNKRFENDFHAIYHYLKSPLIKREHIIAITNLLS